MHISLDKNIKRLDVVQFFVDNKMLYQDKNGNCVFVGYDVNNGMVRCSPAEEVRTHLNRSMVMLQDAIMPNAYVDDARQCVGGDRICHCSMSIMSLVDSNEKYNYLALGGVGK